MTGKILGIWQEANGSAFLVMNWMPYDDSISHKKTYRKMIRKSRRRKISGHNFPPALKSSKCLGNIAADAPARFQGDTNILTPNLSRLREISW